MHNMKENKEHTQYLDELIYKVFADDRNGAIIGSMRNAFRKLASAAMQDGFESGYHVGYKSGIENAENN